MSSARTGWKVPAPTCSVTKARRTPRLRERGEDLGVEVQPRRRRRDRAGDARVDGLIALAIGGARARGRCRAAAAPHREPRRTRARRSRTPGETDRLRARACARCARPGSAHRRPALQALARARVHQRVSRALSAARAGARPCRRVSLMPWTRAGTTRVSLNTSRSPARSSVGKSAKLEIRERAPRAVEHEQPARGARRRGPLRDELLRELEVKVRALHPECNTTNLIAPIAYTARPGMPGWRNW